MRSENSNQLLMQSIGCVDVVPANLLVVIVVNISLRVGTGSKLSTGLDNFVE